jgi:hypothetical protein
MREIKSNIPLSVEFARKKFHARFRKWPDSAPKHEWVLRHELSTPAEKMASIHWLARHGWSEAQIQAVTTHGVTR